MAFLCKENFIWKKKYSSLFGTYDSCCRHVAWPKLPTAGLLVL